MKQVVFWGLLLAVHPAWAASPDSTAVSGIVDDGPSAAQFLENGNERMDQGNYLGAAFQFERAIEKDPSNVAGYLHLGSAYTHMGLAYATYFSKAESTLAHVATMVGKNDIGYRMGMADLAMAQWNV